MRYWIGVVSEQHVRIGVERGIAQIGHGKRAGLAKMQAGDGFVYYSPKETSDSRTPLQAFTAIGTIADDFIWQEDEGDFKPWRRKVDYFSAVNAPIRPLLNKLSFTAGQSNWGYAFRYGLIQITSDDYELIQNEMKE